jgi:hypothetical protein
LLGFLQCFRTEIEIPICQHLIDIRVQKQRSSGVQPRKVNKGKKQSGVDSYAIAHEIKLTVKGKFSTLNA